MQPNAYEIKARQRVLETQKNQEEIENQFRSINQRKDPMMIFDYEQDGESTSENYRLAGQ